MSPLGMLASAISGRDIEVADIEPGASAWTNGSLIFARRVDEICVQGALLAAGSLDRAIVGKLARRPQLATRYLAIEGHRALAALENVLPPSMRTRIDHAIAVRSSSPAASLQLAMSAAEISAPPAWFGTIRARELLAIRETTAPAVKQKALTELPESAPDENADDFATSPVGGGGAIGRLLQKLFQKVRRMKDGGAPGADAPTHWSRSRPSGAVHALTTSSKAETIADAFGEGRGILYPEWDFHQRRYRPDWCTVTEVDPPKDSHRTVEWIEHRALWRALARLGMGVDRFHRRAQGDDIDIDAAIEAHVERVAGSVPDEATYIESLRHRRDLSVLVLLDISGSVTQPSPAGKRIHEQQRTVAAGLISALHEIGDRVALYAFHSQGRTAVHLTPVKRFDEAPNGRVMRRLYGIVPGAYSRLGAAIRHGATLLIERGGTPRRLLLVLSDGLAYDHGYEPAYGAADARQALAEARRDGVGCLCLSVGSNTDAESLRRVFDSAAHAVIPSADQLPRVIAPLFRSALRSAELRRVTMKA